MPDELPRPVREHERAEGGERDGHGAVGHQVVVDRFGDRQAAGQPGPPRRPDQRDRGGEGRDRPGTRR
jgi:hypothetical protein